MTGNTTVYKPKVVDCAYPCNPTCTKTAVSPDEAKLSTTKVNVFVNDYQNDLFVTYYQFIDLQYCMCKNNGSGGSPLHVYRIRYDMMAVQKF